MKVFNNTKEIGLQKEIEFGKSSSSEPIKFTNRSPIFKALMKLEFEKAIREYLRNL